MQRILKCTEPYKILKCLLSGVMELLTESFRWTLSPILLIWATLWGYIKLYDYWHSRTITHRDVYCVYQRIFITFIFQSKFSLNIFMCAGHLWLHTGHYIANSFWFRNNDQIGIGEAGLHSAIRIRTRTRRRRRRTRTRRSNFDNKNFPWFAGTVKSCSINRCESHGCGLRGIRLWRWVLAVCSQCFALLRFFWWFVVFRYDLKVMNVPQWTPARRTSACYKTLKSTFKEESFFFLIKQTFVPYIKKKIGKCKYKCS